MSTLPASIEVFARRLAEAFPTLKGGVTISGDEAVARLKALLAGPLSIGRHAPIWALREVGSMPVERFEVLGGRRVLLSPRELVVDRLLAYRNPDAPERCFAVLICEGDQKTGLYQ